MNDDYKKGYADAMGWKTENHLEHLAQPEQELCCYGGIAHDCHAGEGCRIVKRMKATSPQRTWIGLTLDERIELAQDVDWAVGAYCEYAEKIEAKLKEKNVL